MGFKVGGSDIKSCPKENLKSWPSVIVITLSGLEVPGRFKHPTFSTGLNFRKRHKDPVICFLN